MSYTARRLYSAVRTMVAQCGFDSNFAYFL